MAADFSMNIGEFCLDSDLATSLIKKDYRLNCFPHSEIQSVLPLDFVRAVSQVRGFGSYALNRECLFWGNPTVNVSAFRYFMWVISMYLCMIL